MVVLIMTIMLPTMASSRPCPHSLLSLRTVCAHWPMAPWPWLLGPFLKRTFFLAPWVALWIAPWIARVWKTFSCQCVRFFWVQVWLGQWGINCLDLPSLSFVHSRCEFQASVSSNCCVLSCQRIFIVPETRSKWHLVSWVSVIWSKGQVLVVLWLLSEHLTTLKWIILFNKILILSSRYAIVTTEGVKFKFSVILRIISFSLSSFFKFCLKFLFKIKGKNKKINKKQNIIESR